MSAGFVSRETLNVVQPGRLRIMKAWQGRDIWVHFPVRGAWYLVEHPRDLTHNRCERREPG